MDVLAYAKQKKNKKMEHRNGVVIYGL